MKNLKAIVTLVLISTIVPELLTGSTSFSGFFNLFTFIILFIGYGLAVLAIREFSVRNNLSYKGIFILGFAYAILNEGLMSKTMILSSQLPISQYNNYGYFLGISFPWSISIMAWHAICSVLFPILITYMFFPKASEVPWLNKKLATFLGIITLSIGVLLFFGKTKVTGASMQLIVLLIIMFSLVMLAKKFGRGSLATQISTSTTWKPFWLGFSTFLFFDIILSVIAGRKLPLIIFYLAYISGVWFYIYVLKSKSWINGDNLLLFIIGSYVPTTLLGMILASTAPLNLLPGNLTERLITGIMALILLPFIAYRIIQRSKVLKML